MRDSTKAIVGSLAIVAACLLLLAPSTAVAHGPRLAAETVALSLVAPLELSSQQAAHVQVSDLLAVQHEHKAEHGTKRRCRQGGCRFGHRAQHAVGALGRGVFRVGRGAVRLGRVVLPPYGCRR